VLKNEVYFSAKSVGVCRGVLRVWDLRIQDSRTDFGLFLQKMVGSASTRGWCKMEDSSGVVCPMCIDNTNRLQ
jgi:hypothetical protein